ncbi:LOW QUALITY PROTEIN: tigger transposable element-derived protein 4-like [Alligator sinensis]|uniref:LOW QUALITY PROTEIN: tigger transposable element-derived protein 4-like n=1 Tax=Alligator sinensis TaxID=38654 RepID=A0A3Q0H603_ALLSI|nr:LOW QUALITY PROTEIN: tigger transposable element-derived protein 4-like [Alligator sinensis]
MPRSLSLKEKVEIIQACQVPGASQNQVAVKWDLHRSVVCRIWKQKDKLLSDYEDGQAKSSRKRKREGKAPDVDRALFHWLKAKRAEGALLTGPIIKDKALQLAAAAGLSDFKASDGWFSMWKKRFNITYRKEHGEQQLRDKLSAVQWQTQRLPQVPEKIYLADIYSADKTGYYLKELPGSGLRIKTEKLEGGTISQDRDCLGLSPEEWQDVKPKLISSCFKRGKVIKFHAVPGEEEGGRDAEEGVAPPNDIPLTSKMTEESVADAAARDEGVPGFGEPSVGEFVGTAATRPEKHLWVEKTDDKGTEQVGERDLDEILPPTNADVLKALSMVWHFSRQERLGDKVYRSLQDIKSHLQNKMAAEAVRINRVLPQDTLS